jgi:hypothetical protein
MRKHKGLKSAALALAAFALIASACGGDDATDEATEDTTATEETTAADPCEGTDLKLGLAPATTRSSWLVSHSVA